MIILEHLGRREGDAGIIWAGAKNLGAGQGGGVFGVSLGAENRQNEPSAKEQQ